MIATETARTLFGHASITSVDLQAEPVYEFQIGADREARIVSLGVFLVFAELPTEIALADWKSVLYALVVVQLAISIGGLLGTHSMRSAESTVLAQRAALTSYRSQLDRLKWEAPKVAGRAGSAPRQGDNTRIVSAQAWGDYAREL
jgi:hypothetical protein